MIIVSHYSGVSLFRLFLVVFVFLGSIFCNDAIADQSELIITKHGDVFYDFTVDTFEDPSASLSFNQIRRFSPPFPDTFWVENER